MNCNRSSWTKQVQKRIQTFAADRVLLLWIILHCLIFLVKEKLTQDPDSEVATTSLRCSLLCPVRMQQHGLCKETV